jgi:hypothetical protein
MREKFPLLVNLSVSVASLVVVLGLLELIWRLLGWSPLVRYLGESDSSLGYKYKADLATYITFDGNSYPFKTNSAGFRDRPVPRREETDEFRIVILGDSYVAGHEVPAEKRMSAVLENLLSQCAGTEKVRVINMGVRGFSTLQCLLALEQYAEKWQPDIVLYVFCENDLYDNVDPGLAYEGYSRPRATTVDGRLNVLPFTPISKMDSAISLRGNLRWLCERSALLEFLRLRLYVPLWGRFILDEGNIHHLPWEHLLLPEEDWWQTFYAIMERMLAFTKDLDIDLYTTSIVASWNIDSSYQSEIKKIADLPPHFSWNVAAEKLEEHSKKVGYHFISLREDFLKVENPETLYPGVEDQHWNEKGHSLAARVLARTLAGHID